jgi:hypothetical protein
MDTNHHDSTRGVPGTPPAQPEGGAPERSGLARLAEFTRDPSLAPGTPQVPGVVRFFGVLIVVLTALGMGLGAMQTLEVLSGAKRRSVDEIAFGFGWIIFAVSLLFFLQGMGLRSGKRSGVYGLCIYGGLLLLVGIAFVRGGATEFGLYLVGGIVIVCVPPIISAFRHWAAFR